MVQIARAGPQLVLHSNHKLAGSAAIMAGKSSKFPFRKNGNIPEIPIEIISDEEIVSIDAALASAACSPVTPAAFPAIHPSTSASQLHRKGKSIQSVSVQAKKRLFMGTEPDMEDYGNLVRTQKKTRVAKTLLHRFRSKRGLFVTDVTKTEWCEKQMEFSLFFGESKNNEVKRPGEDLALVFAGGRKNNEAIGAGKARHVQLEQEVLKRVEVKVKSREDYMALKLVNFINGVHQLLFEGLTRELPIVGFAFAEGVWMVGKIDEIRMPVAKKDHNPTLVEIKTRVRDTVPSVPQQRNGRIQLMCYKYLWDNLVADRDFPSKQFFDYFGLNPKRTLCKDLQAATADSGFFAFTLDDVVRYYQDTCRMLAPANNQLLLRYESQKDHSLLVEDRFAYDGGWLKNQIRFCLEFWLGQREATYAAEVEDEQWKCRYCEFASQCPAYTDSESTESLSSDDSSTESLSSDYSSIY